MYSVCVCVCVDGMCELMYSRTQTHQHSVEVKVLRGLGVVATLILELGTVVYQIHHLRLELLAISLTHRSLRSDTEH